MIKEQFLKLIGKYSDDENYNSECWTEIENHYSSKSRHYHNLEHINIMLTELVMVESQIRNLDTLLFAIYYHDIIYKPTKKNNEHQSALVFKKRISKTSFPNLGECMAQIEATKDHRSSPDNDTNYLLDLDLAILGKSPKEYQDYSNNIRKEYLIYPAFVYRKGRTTVLKNLLESDSIYKTDLFKKVYEIQARKNLRNELDHLN